MRRIALVPSLTEYANPALYCNYARMKPYEERCLCCDRQCEHRGKHTVIER